MENYQNSIPNIYYTYIGNPEIKNVQGVLQSCSSLNNPITFICREKDKNQFEQFFEGKEISIITAEELMEEKINQATTPEEEAVLDSAKKLYNTLAHGTTKRETISAKNLMSFIAAHRQPCGMHFDCNVRPGRQLQEFGGKYTVFPLTEENQTAVSFPYLLPDGADSERWRHYATTKPSSVKHGIQDIWAMAWPKNDENDIPKLTENTLKTIESFVKGFSTPEFFNLCEKANSAHSNAEGLEDNQLCLNQHHPEIAMKAVDEGTHFTDPNVQKALIQDIVERYKTPENLTISQQLENLKKQIKPKVHSWYDFNFQHAKEQGFYPMKISRSINLDNIDSETSTWSILSPTDDVALFTKTMEHSHGTRVYSSRQQEERLQQIQAMFGMK